jgi:protein-S-isoprenylcysteine O-methyltransferase Ste14
MSGCWSTMQASVRGPAIIAPPPLLFAGPWLLGFLLDQILPLPRLPLALRLVGLPLTAAGLAVLVWFLTTMRRAGTPVDPREAPTALVQAGPFRHTRNPAYGGWTLLYLGVALLAGSRWALILLPAVLVAVDRGVIRREERYLEDRFGADYREYRRRVRRWL